MSMGITFAPFQDGLSEEPYDEEMLEEGWEWDEHRGIKKLCHDSAAVGAVDARLTDRVHFCSGG